MTTATRNLKDHFRGCMVGMAIGDALGAASEFMTEQHVRSRFGVLKDYHGTSYFDPGEFTDDTSMALAVAEATIEAGSVDAAAIADAFVDWMHRDGRGIGNLTCQALRLVEAGHSPAEAGLQAWERSGKTSAGNGAVMRCAPLGLLNYKDPDALLRDSVLVSRITHYDPRCCWSTVAVNAAVAAMLNGESPHDAGAASVKGQCKELEDALSDAAEQSVESMRLDGPDQGYTILTTQAAFAALLQYDEFENGIIAIVNKGGDADTNACVAGALMGARCGFDALPKRWVEGLVGLDRVLAAADGLYESAAQ